MLDTFREENPYWRWMGFAVDEAAAKEGRAVVTVALRPEFMQHQRVVHGGVLSALIDSAGAWAFALEHQEPVRTINLSVQYLSPVQSDQGQLVAESHIVRAGRRIVIADVGVLSPPDNEVARGQVIYSRATGAYKVSNRE